jgi:hypothetical protein
MPTLLSFTHHLSITSAPDSVGVPLPRSRAPLHLFCHPQLHLFSFLHPHATIKGASMFCFSVLAAPPRPLDRLSFGVSSCAPASLRPRPPVALPRSIHLLFALRFSHTFSSCIGHGDNVRAREPMPVQRTPPDREAMPRSIYIIIQMELINQQHQDRGLCTEKRAPSSVSNCLSQCMHYVTVERTSASLLLSYMRLTCLVQS